MAAWLAGEPSSSNRPLQLGAVVFQRSAGPRLRAIRIALSGSIARLAAIAGEVAQQPVVEVFEVVDPFAQIRVAGLAEAGAMLGRAPARPRLRR